MKQTLSALIILLFLVACIPFWREVPREVTPEPSTTPVVCAGWSEGMKVRVAPKTGTFVILELEGFQPGEQLTFLFIGEIPGTSSSRLESRPAAVVGEDGRFIWDIGLGGIPQINHWQGKIIHESGVTCFEFTLPLLAPIEFSDLDTVTPLPFSPSPISAHPSPTRESPTATPTPGADGGFDCAGGNQIPSTECAALVALYNSTNGPGWADNSGWLVTNTPCSWTGITCTGGHVSHISLSYNQLSGPLPPALGNLSHLRAIDLGANELRGPIPAEWGNLSDLVSLHLWDNLLTGPLPAELENLRKLRSLSLAHNQIGGSIPATLGKIKSLESLDLSHNQFSGAITAELGELDNLYALDLSHNQLSGVIPDTFSNLSKLDELDLSYNQLSGPIPESMVHISQHMLWGNQLEGTITTDEQAPFTVDYRGFHFSADPSLAISIWPEVKPATPLPEDLEGPSYWLAIPEHIRFTFADPGLSPGRLRMGFNLAAEAQILVFPLAELAEINPLVQTQIETLRNLLAERGTIPTGELPLLPLTNSAQVFHAQAQYLEFGNSQGLRFISQHSQDPHPIMLSQELFYTFQGFTDDDAYYVAAFFPLTTAVLPDKIEVEDWDAFHADYDAYLSETTAVLDQLPATEFTPDLTLLDAVVTSLQIEPDNSASGSLAYNEPIVVEQLPSVAALDLNIDPTAGLIAYQRNKQLWLAKADLSGDSFKLAECVEQDEVICDLPSVHWSPDGSHFFYELTVDGEHRILVSDLQGQQQGYRISRPPSRDPVWSPDGNKIIFFVVDPNRPWGDHSKRGLSPLDIGFIEEVWQLQMGASGTWLAPQKLTDLETPGIGCGGGGVSISDSLYDIQGGFALGYQAARQMVWTVDDVIIYPLTCDYWQGYGRLDAQRWQPLAPYSGLLRGLVLDSSGSRWYAVTGHNRDNDPTNNRLITGTAGSTTYEVIDTAVPVEMVFVGSQTGRLYYTARQLLDHKDLSEQIKWNKSVEPYFNFYHTQLWTILPDGTDEKLLWESDVHSFSRFTKTTGGDVLFVLVENDVALFEVIAGGAPEEEWIEHLPHTHIMRLSLSSNEPEIWLEDAHSLTTWYPRALITK